MSDRSIRALLNRSVAVPAALNTNQLPRESESRKRRGVILLIVMVLLTLMTLLGLTLVLVTAQGRLSALAAARSSLASENNASELASTVTQVVVGSTDPNSSIGAHGLLEDLYGLPQFYGQIAPTSVGTSVLPIGETAQASAFLAGGNNGTLLQLLVIAGNINPSTGVPTGLTGIGTQSSLQYLLPQNSGAFCGQVVTMITGPAAGQSARVVGYYFNPANAAATPPFAAMQVTSFGGMVPKPGDQFVINGRPFSGTGFGLDLTQFNGGGVWGTNVAGVPIPTTVSSLTGLPALTGDIPLLTAMENITAVNPQPTSNMPYAYLPNHARIALSGFAPLGAGTYWDPAGPGGANETYDAPDFQNLMLAMHYYSPFLLPTNSPVGVITPIPSLHRPELVAWFYNQAIINTNPAISMAMPAMRRKVILRPEPTDHYFLDANANGVWDPREPWHDVNGDGLPNDTYADGTPAFLDLNGDGSWTAGETDYAGNTFNPVTGCWFVAANGAWALDTAAGLDVDNDKDGTPDSIWVDVGQPVHTEADGTLTKNLAAILCIDLDGKVNLNATGTLAQLDSTRYPGGIVSGPVAGAGGSESLYSDALFQRTAPVGQGYGPADINPLHVFVRSHAPASLSVSGAPVSPTYTYSTGSTNVLNSTLAPQIYYRTFLQGFDFQTFLSSYNGWTSYPSADALPPVLQVDGRYAESARLTVPPGTLAGFSFPGVYPLGSYYLGGIVQPPLFNSVFSGPRPGWSQWFDPYNTSLLSAVPPTNYGYWNLLTAQNYWVNDAVSLARFSDFRPGLITPALRFLSDPTAIPLPFFFDFLPDVAYPKSGPGYHLPTAHGTPSDLHSRGVLYVDLTGRPYYGGTATVPWQAMSSMWAGAMYDYSAGQYSGNWPFLAAEVPLNDFVDTQYEMDLTQNARQGGQNSGNSINGIPDFPTVDAKLTPSELEGLLRTNEQGASGAADSSSLLSRLNNLETAANYLNTLALGTPNSTSVYSLLANKNTSSNTPPTKISPRNDIRLAVTSESWDLPVPNLALTPRQLQDLIEYVNHFSGAGFTGPNALINGQTLSLNNLSLVDLARARILADNSNPTTTPSTIDTPGFTVPLLSITTVAMADIPLFGNMKNVLPNVLGGLPAQAGASVFPVALPVWPLLPPETVLGMRLDVNRLLGNGHDDNGNGVVDEPEEVLWSNLGVAPFYGESLYYPFSQISAMAGPAGQINAATGMNNSLAMLDLNNDGFYPANPATGISYFADPQTGTVLPGDPTLADMRARQLLARHLYCLAMLLLDDRPHYATTNVMAQIFNSSDAVMPLPLPPYSMLASMPREQAAYVIAQWAINVVDFRDRDSIMTPFEFDLYPFRADNAAQPNVTWNVDDIIGTATGIVVSLDDIAPYRGLVWGCERPELLLTETVAFHDRGTADTQKGENLDNQNDPDTLVGQGGPPTDNDYDQVRRPRGSLIVELFNPTSYWDAPQLDLQTNDLQNTITPLPQPWQFPDGNGNQGSGINLAQISTSGGLSSPVWRLAIAYSPTYNESAFYTQAATSPYSAANGAQKQIDPRVPVLPFTYTAPGSPSIGTTVHRAVYFAPYQPAFTTTFGTTQYVTDVLLNQSFFADPNAFLGYLAGTNAPTMMLPPGQYALVGPGNSYAGANNGLANYMIFAGQNAPTAANPGGSPQNNAAMSIQLGLAQTTVSSVAKAGVVNGPFAVPGYGTTSAAIKPTIGVPIQTTWFQKNGANAVYVPHTSTAAPGGGTTITTTLRMSVSEPEHGYPLWPNSTVGSLYDDDAYYSNIGTPNNAAIPTLQNFPQHPFDSGLTDPVTGNSYLQFGDMPNSYVASDGSADMAGNPNVTTTPGYTVIFLQRLANPLEVWDALANPYITVDSMPVDLCAYTGEPDAASSTTTGEPQAGYPNGKPGTLHSFDTRRRGYNPTNGAQTLLLAQGVPNIWTPMPLIEPGLNPYAGGGFGLAAGDGTIAAPMLLQTLGYVNTEYSGGVYYSTAVGSTNIPNVGTSGMPAYKYCGDPLTPFPWLAWNNRPYISQFELMLVPASSPSSQLQDFGMLGWSSAGGSALSEYQPYPATGSNPTPKAGMLPGAQFMQLLNFFNNEQTLSLTEATNLTVMPNLYRIFEFLQVPSRYTGTQDLLNPSQFSGDDAVGTVFGVNTQIVQGTTSHLFHPPFNWLPRFREPGRINLNTIFDPVVFQSLMDDYPGTLYANGTNNTDSNPVTGLIDAMVFPRGLWASLTQSRQGFYQDFNRPYIWNGIPQLTGPYTVNYGNPSTATPPWPVPNPSAPPNPISQYAYNTSLKTPGLNSDMPTYFANPFRPDGSAAFVPQADLNAGISGTYSWLNYQKLMHQWTYPSTQPNPLLPSPPAPPFVPSINNGVNATVLRSQVLGTDNGAPMIVYPANPPTLLTPTALPPANGPGPLALFDGTSFDTTNLGATYNNGKAATARNAGQDAAFQYQMLTRLGNNVTNRSNVYAIWVTLGKFQVQPVGASPSNPDGYKLVQPYLDGAGNQVVTRGFYVFDRSIPMGFQRGQDMNIEKGFLVEHVLQEPSE